MADNEITVFSPDDEIEIAVIDDTPPQDRGRAPLSPEKVASAEPSDEELATYSESVQKRIKQMKHALHDQRRVAEQADRERAAALQYATSMKQQAEQLQQRYNAGERVFVDGMKDKAKTSMEAASAKLKAATEAFDADAITEATKEIARAAFEEKRYEGWTQNNAGQAEQDGVQTRQTEPPRSSPTPKPDARAQAWAAKNPWFTVDDELTGYAYGVDAALTKQGITPAVDPDEYYGEIDRRLRERFPDKFEDGEDSPPRQRAARQDPPRSTVAPVRRSASGKRVITLSKSEAEAARKLGVSPAAYAAEVLKIQEAANG